MNNNNNNQLNEIQQRIEEVISNQQKTQVFLNQEEAATGDSIVRKWEAIHRHLKKMRESCQKGEFEFESLEEKITILKKRIQHETQHLTEIRKQYTIWNTKESRYIETREEFQTDGTKMVSLIYKKNFVGPLLRIQQIVDQDGHILEEINMAAEHLTVKLNPGENASLLIQRLNEVLPENKFTMEDVSPQISLYRLCFQPLASEVNPQKRLNLFDQVNKIIQEKHLAIDCYPDLLLTLTKLSNI